MKNIIVLFGAMLISTLAAAQNYRMELFVRGNTYQTIESSEQKDTNSPPIAASAELLFFPKGFIGIGPFLSRSVISGDYQYYNYDQNFFYYNTETSSLDYQMYGLALQFSTNKTKRFRFYAVGRAGKMEIVETFEEYSMGRSGTMYSGGLGVILKLSRRVNFNIFDANYMILSKELDYINDEKGSAVHVQSGFSYRFLRKK